MMPFPRSTVDAALTFSSVTDPASSEKTMGEMPSRFTDCVRLSVRFLLSSPSLIYTVDPEINSGAESASPERRSELGIGEENRSLPSASFPS